MQCNECRYYHERECRRFPPFHGFPLVNGSSWCGEWKEKDVVKAELAAEEEKEIDDFLETYKKRGWPKGKPRK